ncbi:holin [Bacillus phage Bastille]|uniref:HNH endonuclease domain protein n=5 Tax=Bastillevirus TaxID=1918010 RepID=A0A024B140_9CAUD|nr:holin [Bacillus phage Bastille]YP_009035377.1 holin [Bacillus phage Hoody T]YP_009035703.1 holin [Bacillus phage Evoli]YP_009037086.1 holin [Bacillus phage CAM003]ASR79533.1 holin [Bacillus phage OTooleKemple52]ASR79808.1 holin [Bacillus phage Janet]ASU01036.1 holin [Bacillus phage Anthony]AXQ67167.1 holin [Bacillus phage Kamfam]AZF89282.1 holin [Bacillus phage vB_BthM-Goe5]
MDNQNHKEQTVFVPEEAPAITAGTLVRFVVFLVAIVNAISAMLGHALNWDVDQNMLYEVFSAVLLLVSAGHMAWKNNNVTKQARIKAHVAEQITNDKETK